MTELTAERARELFDYDPETGVLTRRAGPAKGRVVEGYSASGHQRVLADGRLYSVHRLAWLIMTGEWPVALVDHRNGNASDNRWDNLRQATNSQNRANGRLLKPTRSGLKGAYKTRSGRWQSVIRKDYKLICLGTFDTPEEAHAAYCKAAQELHGEFARPN